MQVFCIHSDYNYRYGPPTRTEYRLIVENLSSRISWQVRDWEGDATGSIIIPSPLTQGRMSFAVNRGLGGPGTITLAYHTRYGVSDGLGSSSWQPRGEGGRILSKWAAENSGRWQSIMTRTKSNQEVETPRVKTKLITNWRQTTTGWRNHKWNPKDIERRDDAGMDSYRGKPRCMRSIYAIREWIKFKCKQINKQ